MSVETTYIGETIPICRLHTKERMKYDEKTETIRCPICDGACSTEEWSRSKLAPYYWNQCNPYVVFLLPKELKDISRPHEKEGR
jgi:hypothetical protein